MAPKVFLWFLCIFVIQTGILNLYAAETADWKQVLEAFTNSSKFEETLKEFVRSHRNEASEYEHLYFATKTLSHLETSGLKYSSVEDLLRQIALLVAEKNSILALDHLKWLQEIIENMELLAPKSRSVREAKNAVEALLEMKMPMPKREAVINLVNSLANTHLVEREIMEKTLGVTFDNPIFGTLVYRQIVDGTLKTSFERMVLGSYLNLRQFFTPSLRQSREALARLASTGDRGLVLRRARQFTNTRNFVRNGWDPDFDYLRVATGDMIERAYKVEDEVQTPMRSPQINRNILLCVDVTSSMHKDGRGQLRDMIVPSYVDQIFSQAHARNEKTTLYVIYYADNVKRVLKLSSLAEAKAEFSDMIEVPYAFDSWADHAGAVVYGVDEILKRNEKISHLNIILVTDAEEPVDIGKIKNRTDKLTSGADGLRLGVSAIAFVSGQKHTQNVAKAISSSDNRYATNDPTVQFFSEESVVKWTTEQWIKDFFESQGDSVWIAKPDDISKLSSFLRQIDLNQVEIAPIKRAGSELDELAVDQNGNGQKDQSELASGDAGDAGDAGESDQIENEDNSSKKEGSHKEETLENKPQMGNFEGKGSKLLYQLKTGSNPKPGFLGVAIAENMPISLAGGIGSALRARDLLPVETVSDIPENSLEVESRIVTRVTKGLAPLAKPRGYSLAHVELLDTNGKKFEGYKVYEITRNGLYLIAFKKVPPKGKFFYKAHYVRDLGVNRRSPLYDNLDKRAMSVVSRLLYLDELHRTAGVLNLLSTRKRAVAIEDMERGIKKDAAYTFLPESKDPPTTNGLFSPFQKFLKKGRLHYQCNGANPIQSTIINSYAKAAKKESLFAENVHGYGVEDLEITEAMAHVVTVVSDSKIPYSFKILDATPTEMDPESRQMQRSPSENRYLRWLREFYWQVNDFIARPVRRRFELNLQRRLAACNDRLALE